MADRRNDKIVLSLLRIAYATPRHERPAGAGVDVPPQDWTVDGVLVTRTERMRAIETAHGARYVVVREVAKSLVPVELTAAGRRFVQEWENVRI